MFSIQITNGIKMVSCYKLNKKRKKKWNKKWYEKWSQKWIFALSKYRRQATVAFAFAALAVIFLLVLGIVQNIYTKIIMSVTIVYMQIFMMLAGCFQAQSRNT